MGKAPTTRFKAVSSPQSATLPVVQVPKPTKKVPAFFFMTKAGNEPVRDWLKALLPAERKSVGEDINTVELGWPIGMPTCRPLGDGLHEVRTNLPNRITRVVFFVDTAQRMVLLHAFFKTTEKMPDADMKLSVKRKSQHVNSMRRDNQSTKETRK